MNEVLPYRREVAVLREVISSAPHGMSKGRFSDEIRDTHVFKKMMMRE